MSDEQPITIHPNSEIKAIMSLVGAGELHLPQDVALNGIPSQYWAVKRSLAYLGLSDDGSPLLSSLESEGKAVAFDQCADIGTRIASTLDLSDSPSLTTQHGNQASSYVTKNPLACGDFRYNEDASASELSDSKQG